MRAEYMELIGRYPEYRATILAGVAGCVPAHVIEQMVIAHRDAGKRSKPQWKS